MQSYNTYLTFELLEDVIPILVPHRCEYRSSMTGDLIECSWNTDDDARTQLVGKVHFVSWVALNELDAGDKVSDFDHDCDY